MLKTSQLLFDFDSEFNKVIIGTDGAGRGPGAGGVFAAAVYFDKITDETIEKNYIGGATFLEIYDAFRLNKKIYLYNDIPEGMLYDEIQGFAPIIINGDLSKIKEDL